MKTLQQYLEENRITQAQFAARIGCTQANVSKLCSETPRISPDMAARIARETGGVVPVTAWPQFRVFAAHSSSPSSAPLSEAS